jgi:hypothetical protein
LEWAAKAIDGSQTLAPPDLVTPRRQLDARFVSLRQTDMAPASDPGEVMRFCAFVFNLRGVTTELIGLLRELASGHIAPGTTETMLSAAYRDTDYRVEGPEGQFVVRVGQRSPELEALLTRHRVECWAFVTAYNPASVRQPEWINRERQTELEGEVTAAGYALYPGEGTGRDSSWPAEPSVLVLGIPRQAAVAVARKYGQNAIVCGIAGQAAELVWV